MAKGDWITSIWLPGKILRQALEFKKILKKLMVLGRYWQVKITIPFFFKFKFYIRDRLVHKKTVLMVLDSTISLIWQMSKYSQIDSRNRGSIRGKLLIRGFYRESLGIDGQR